MDLEARVTVLEDEMGILKGEIKSVLLEVRTAFLAQGNPFTNQSLTLAAPAASMPMAMPEAPRPVNPTPSFVNEPTNLPPAQVAPEAPVTTVAQAVPAAAVATKPAAAAASANAIEAAPAPKRFDMNTLAMLMAWTQGNMARLSLEEMSSLLSLARYGGVIEPELEMILSHIANHFDQGADAKTGIVKQRQAATISEYLLALHELHTVLNEQDESAFRWLRKIA